MIDCKSIGQQSILRFHHVDVTVARKLRVQSIARLARFAVADSIREHDEKSRGVEQLVLSEKFAGEFRPNKLRAAAGGPVDDQNGITRFAPIVFVNLAECSIMNSQFG